MWSSRKTEGAPTLLLLGLGKTNAGLADSPSMETQLLKQTIRQSHLSRRRALLGDHRQN
jgi:hypothetical protein